VDDQQPKPTPTEITVRAYKYDGSEHRRWTAQLTCSEGTMLQLTGAFDVEIDHTLLGRIARGTVSVEHYWMDRWYSVFRFSEPTGELRNYYCNVNAPPSFDGSVLSFVDLDIDILVAPDFTYSILDEEEFAENALRFDYPIDIQQRVNAAVVELIHLIESRQFPFGENV
jgi:protein associated with RNAse G/E